eukprot:g469.t1
MLTSEEEEGGNSSDDGFGMRRSAASAQTRKNRNIYGVFAGNGGKRPNNKIRPITFVSSKNKSNPQMSTPPESSASTDIEVSNVPDEATKTMMSNSQFSAFLSAKSTAKAEDRSSEKVDPRAKLRPKRVAIKKNLGSWEKNTKGFGMKMLMKMGFKGRLGKYEQGTTAPIAVKLRTKNAGLGADGREAVNLKANREFERELYGTESDDRGTEGIRHTPEGGNSEANMDFARAWRRKELRRRKASYKTASEIAENGQNAEKSDRAYVIYDYRGAEMRKLGSIGEIGTLGDAAASVSDKDDLLQHKLEMRRDSANALAKEVLRLERENLLTEKSVSDREDVLSVIVRLESEAESMKSSDLLSDTMRLRELYPDLWSRYGLVAIVHELGPICLRVALKDWRPLEDGSEPLIALMRPWRDFLLQSNEGKAPCPLGAHVYGELITSVCSDPVRAAVVNRWSVENVGVCVHLFQGLREIVPNEICASMLESLVLPKLRRAIDALNSAEAVSQAHRWAQPWLHPLLLGPERLAPLWPSIRRRINTLLLKHWNLNDTTALSVLKAWKALFSESHLRVLLNSRVLPKLSTALRGVRIDRRGIVDKETLQRVLAWAAVLSDVHLFDLFEGDFFPRWFYVVADWVSTSKETGSNSIDFDEVSRWYRDSKGIFEESGLLQQCPRLEHPFRSVLRLLAALTFKDEDAIRNIVHAVPKPDETSFESMTLQRRTAERMLSRKALRAAAYEASRSAIPQKSEAASRLTFREVVEIFASKNSISFVPNVRRGEVDGNQVYDFGNVSVYLNRNVAFAQSKDDRFRWDPVDLSELLRRNGKA